MLLSPDGRPRTLSYPAGAGERVLRSYFRQFSRPVDRTHRPTGRQRPDAVDDDFDGQLYHAAPKHLRQNHRGTRGIFSTKRKDAPSEPVELGERPTARPRQSTRVMPANAAPPADSGGDLNSDDASQAMLIEVHSDEQVRAFYRDRFRMIQQLACKQLAKAWIKICEPKKQSHYPYRGGSPTAPPWWPLTSRHKEPDHLKKEGGLFHFGTPLSVSADVDVVMLERLDVLVYIIMHQPNTTVEKLQGCAAEITCEIFVRRRCLLEDVFLVASERKRSRGELRGTGASCNLWKL